ncbi:MAG TPA: peptidylprolyl isomerase [Devosia sp.]|nr:peptidylprolyl isomerase [Devosia sp.]
MKLFKIPAPAFAVRALLAAVFLTLLLPVAAQAATIKITVNDVPITDTQIAQRAKLLQLERRGGSSAGRNRLAREELIDEILKIQEATRIGQAPTPAEVAQAYLNVSRNMRVSTDNLTRILNDNGVNSTTLKDRLRAAIAWGKVTGTVVSARVQISDIDLEARAAEQVTEADSIDYILKEILFIIPQGSGISNSQRTAQANQYRRSFQGCDTAVELSLSYRDAAVLDLGRRHATQLPDPIANELARLNEGGITAPRVVSNGVSMLAICSKTVARDLSFATNELRQEAGNELLEAEAEKYLAELRDKARIVNL